MRGVAAPLCTPKSFKGVTTMSLQRNICFGALAFTVGVVVLARPVQAVVTHNANVTNGVYFGSGNVNGGWTVSNEGGVTLSHPLIFSPVIPRQ